MRSQTFSKILIILCVFSGCSPIPAQYRADVGFALRKSGPNQKELLKAINGVELSQREGIAFLLAHMSERDSMALHGDFLIENVRLAYAARDRVPWGASIPQDVFLNDVLPYANLDERRENWRRIFYERFLPAAQKCSSIQEAVLLLNDSAFKELNVSYHATLRPKPNQSPLESMEAHYASCTGLSILIVDVLRSVGIPARVTATPLWTDKSGNHTWFEVWDNGTWHHLGAAESIRYNDAWFNDIASRADPQKNEHRIYAASFKKTELRMPMVWNHEADDVYAVDVTERYINNDK